MRWSWPIGRIAGIAVYLHFTFVLFLLWIGFSAYTMRKEWIDVVVGVAFMLCLFGIVVLHELGHALAARRYGVKTRDITLLPIGGIARLERIPEDPKQELVIAIAGPAVNVVLALLFMILLQFTKGFAETSEVLQIGGAFLDQLMWVNIILAVFNMIPAFPMDGGRVLRALLAFRLDYLRATQIAASVGQLLAITFGLVGLFILHNPLLAFVGLFVWFGATQEAGMVQTRYILSSIPIERAMITHFQVLHPDDTLGAAVDHILAGFQEDFPVLADGQVVGILTRSDLLRGLAEKGQDMRVGEVMHEHFEVAHPHEMLDHVLARLQNGCCRTLPVVRNGELLGIVTMDNLAELLLIEQALHARPAPPPRRTTQPEDEEVGTPF